MCKAGERLFPARLGIGQTNVVTDGEIGEGKERVPSESVKDRNGSGNHITDDHGLPETETGEGEGDKVPPTNSTDTTTKRKPYCAWCNWTGFQFLRPPCPTRDCPAGMQVRLSRSQMKDDQSPEPSGQEPLS
jgi:hypothetical protein